MAINDGLGISVTVEINKTAATEYADPDPSPDEKYPAVPVVSKYIESKDDQEYVVACLALPEHRWLSTDKDNALSFYVYTDGTYRASMVFRPSNQEWQSPLLVDGVVVRPPGASYETLRKFRFDAVKTVDGADSREVKRDLERAAGLGTIRVEVWRARITGPGNPPQDQVADGSDLSIAEKALKGRSVSHGTSLSVPNTVGISTWHRTEKLFGRPYVIFHFKYRSREGLRSEMIVPRTPSPELVPPGLAGLGQDEIQRLAEERLAQLKKEEKKGNFKREFDEIFDLTGEDADGSPRPVKILRRRPTPETIDLTDD